MPSIIKVDQLQSDTGNVTVSGNLIFAGAATITNYYPKNAYSYQGDPSATVSTNGTLTAAQILSGIIPTSGSPNLTMPTATNLNAALPANFPINGAFDFAVIDTDAGTTSLIASSGVGFVGSASVGSNSSALFRVRKASGNTYTVYRIA